ncbi:hypothetical protein P5673_028091 [Acropora cervicornis]|uniref:Uncharacterized protein n=1 Tax=Acropora cervicornis TaxID=6130 RepID=A0AAD9UV63_ACRCE|nr:hypothetical protein P5673_028091 [Acropora cervicornis]
MAVVCEVKFVCKRLWFSVKTEIIRENLTYLDELCHVAACHYIQKTMKQLQHFDHLHSNNPEPPNQMLEKRGSGMEEKFRQHISLVAQRALTQ